MIDEKKLLEEIEMSMNENPHKDGKVYMNHVYEHQNFIKMVHEQQKFDEWIPLTERIPDFEQQVLICFDFKGKRSIDIGHVGSEKRVYCDSDEYLTAEGRKYRKAVAWMPLPEPYKK